MIYNLVSDLFLNDHFLDIRTTLRNHFVINIKSEVVDNIIVVIQRQHRPIVLIRFHVRDLSCYVVLGLGLCNGDQDHRHSWINCYYPYFKLI